MKKYFILSLLFLSLISYANDKIPTYYNSDFNPVVYLTCVNGKPTYFCEKKNTYNECSREKAFRLTKDNTNHFPSVTMKDLEISENMMCNKLKK